ncbi:uncharacterized protein BDZ99DRAFT_289778 [Mytilinidion resinicola]|uniref:Uncharacterized protein n=1 Tax=Mytilinidion resinicola TaxID=574789 RepID=A0A6A6YPZ0_9PEZI|nr:uncharacterized protein BDZ99DRAFT_289778 [Mytilinidion resinicola]KAF2810821.1 hypothetical protein BDZ99DRAFT_289778 [Mytilinidion resinicola]
MTTATYSNIVPSTTARRISNGILTICGVLLCAPCLCYQIVTGRVDDRRREKKKRCAREAAQRLDTPRPRPARERTLSLYGIESSQSMTEHRLQSGFFSRLPLEFRLLIYADLLGTNIFHIWIEGQAGPPSTHRLRSNYCAESNRPDSSLQCYQS